MKFTYTHITKEAVEKTVYKISNNNKIKVKNIKNNKLCMKH